MILNDWISVWARLREDEVIPIPIKYRIHPDFLKQISMDEFVTAFTQIHTLFRQIYHEIALSPEEYGTPLYEKDRYRVFSPQWRASGSIPYRPFELLYYLLISGELAGQEVCVSLNKFIMSNTVKNVHFLFRIFNDYGFYFNGLKNYKLTKEDVYISYPDNSNILLVLKMMADKAYNTNRLVDFLCCNFRLFQDNMNTSIVDNCADAIADRVPIETEKEFVYKMDETLMSMGMSRKPYGGFEGYGLAYYDTEKAMNAKSPYTFRMVSRDSDIENSFHDKERLLLMLRIRHVDKCLDYLNHCPDSVKKIFRFSDPGCSNRPCNKGVAYVFEDNSYWRCGCCAPAFIFKPKIEDIPHYIKLVELGK